MEVLGRQQQPALAVKGQVTGPFTLLAGLRNENDRLALYDPQLRDVVVKTLALKAQWQVEYLSRSSLPVIVFIDEPALAGFGSSAFISVSAEDITTMLDEVVSHIHKAGGLAGDAVLVPPGAPQSLAEGIQRVLDDRELAQRLSAQACEDVQAHTWNKRARRILDGIEATGQAD